MSFIFSLYLFRFSPISISISVSRFSLTSVSRFSLTLILSLKEIRANRRGSLSPSENGKLSIPDDEAQQRPKSGSVHPSTELEQHHVFLNGCRARRPGKPASLRVVKPMYNEQLETFRQVEEGQEVEALNVPNTAGVNVEELANQQQVEEPINAGNVPQVMLLDPNLSQTKGRKRDGKGLNCSSICCSDNGIGSMLQMEMCCSVSMLQNSCYRIVML
ncbi:hypothetical protein Dimus_013589 [Dionaea muscipula]